jgi:hypothetical protein
MFFSYFKKKEVTTMSVEKVSKVLAHLFSYIIFFFFCLILIFQRPSSGSDTNVNNVLCNIQRVKKVWISNINYYFFFFFYKIYNIHLTN